MRKLLIAFSGAAALAAVLLGTAVAAQTGPQARTTQLSILHVGTGCHTWFDGQHMSPALRLRLDRGARLRIANRDIDMHRLVQTAGPRLPLRHATMRMNGTMTVAFRKAGLYRFKTVVMEMEGMAADGNATGPDNKLRLTVRVV